MSESNGNDGAPSGEENKNTGRPKEPALRSKTLSIVKKKLYTNLAKPALPEHNAEPIGSIKVILEVLKKRGGAAIQRRASDPSLNAIEILTTRRKTLSEPIERKNKSENCDSPAVRNNHGENYRGHPETCIDA